MTLQTRQNRILQSVIILAQMVLSGWALLGCGIGAKSVPTSIVPEGRVLTPENASVEQTGSQQFALVPAGSGQGPINWQVEPSLGTITPDGLYTAPASVEDQRTVTVTASSANSQTSSATVMLTPSSIPANFMGLNVGDTYHRNPSFKFGMLATNSHVSWASMNPARGVYNFDSFDQLLSYAQTHNSELLVLLNGTPAWASSNPTIKCAEAAGTCAPPSNLQYWDDFLSALAVHAKGKSGIKWSIWNEAQDPHYWTGSVQGMVTMAQHAWAILKAADSKAQIISPTITGFPEPGPQWLASYFAAGGGKYADIIGFHGYSTATAEDVLSTVSAVKDAMRVAGLSSMPLWNTEGDWAGAGNIGQPSQADQDAFIPRYFLLQWSAGVSRVVWYEYDGGNPWGGLEVDYVETSASISYAETYKWLVGSSITQPCAKSASNVWTCGLKTNGIPMTIVWSETAQTYTAPPEYFVSRDITGAERVIINHKVAISKKPVLLEVLPLMLQKK